MTVKYIYLDKTRYSQGHFETEPWQTWQIHTDDDYSMDTLATSGENSASDPVASGIDQAFDEDYWFTTVPASGYARLTLDPIGIRPQTLSLWLRNWAAATGSYIKDIYVSYQTLYNLIPNEVFIASGYLEQFTLVEGLDYVNTEFQLNFNNNSGEYYDLLPTGIPTLEFKFIDPVAAAEVRISEIVLYSSGIEWTPLPSSSGDITLFIQSIANENDSIDLYLLGNDYTLNSGIIPLYLISHEKVPCDDCLLLDENSNIILDEDDHPLLGECCDDPTITLFVSGDNTSFNNLDLYINGAFIASGDITLYTFSSESDNESMILFTKSTEGIEDNNNLHLYLFSTANSGLYNYIPLVLGSDGLAPDYLMDLYVHGSPNPIGSSGWMNLVLSSIPSISGGLELFIQNEVSGVNNYISVYVSGGGLNSNSLPGSVPASSVIPLVMWRDYEGVIWSTSLYTAGPIPDSGIIPLYMMGGPSLTENIDLYISGIDPKFNTVRLFMKGI